MSKLINAEAYSHFIDLQDVSHRDLRKIIDLAHHLKHADPFAYRNVLEHKTIGVLFCLPSTRTRLSFDVAIRQLGGQSIILDQDGLQSNRGETVQDTAMMFSNFLDTVVIRAKDHAFVQAMATYGSIPVINGLTSWSHPCQVMADLLTIEELFETKTPIRIAWIGDVNNMMRSTIHASTLFGYELRLAIPKDLEIDQETLQWAAEHHAKLEVTHDALVAAQDADVVMTDSWRSLGKTFDETRKKVFSSLQVTSTVMAQAKSTAVFMHCMPVHRGEEVEAAVVDGPQSVIRQQAMNRLHIQKAILCWCLSAQNQAPLSQWA